LKVQHWIQEKEGFAKGGNPEVESFKKPSTKTDILYDRLKKEFDTISARMRIANKDENWVLLNDLIPKQEQILSKMKTLYPQGSGYGRYKSLSGEIESRDVAFRRLYSDYERSRTQPYSSQGIPPNEAITRFNKSGLSMMIGPEWEKLSCSQKF